MSNTANVSYVVQDNSLWKSVLPLSQLLSDQVTLILQWLLLTGICQSLAVFGAVTNVINIICFVKQGFKDPVNISLLGLTISDLGCLLTIIWNCIHMTPVFIDLDLPYDSIEFNLLTGAWPHATFGRVTSWITALITLERCLCITLPLKVKSMVTPRRMFIIIVVVYILLVTSISPMYVIYSLGVKYFSKQNKTLIGLIVTPDKDRIERISFAVNNVFIPFSAFALVIVCTTILVIKLHVSATWGQSVTQFSNSSYNRNIKVAKMVVIISSLFIVCSLPFCVAFLAFMLEPRLNIHGPFRNMVFVTLSICAILESVNSSMNIFIYYGMSSRYRAILLQIFYRVIKSMRISLLSDLVHDDRTMHAAIKP